MIISIRRSNLYLEHYCSAKKWIAALRSAYDAQRQVFISCQWIDTTSYLLVGDDTDIDSTECRIIPSIDLRDESRNSVLQAAANYDIINT